MHVRLPCPAGCIWEETCAHCRNGYYRVSSDQAIAQKESGFNDRCIPCHGSGVISEKVVDCDDPEDESDWDCGVQYGSDEPRLFKGYDSLMEWVDSVWEQHKEVKG